MKRLTDFLLLLALLPAAVVPFVPFAFGESPLSFVGEKLGPGLMAVPFFLGMPLVLWQFRQIVGKSIARWERKLAYAFSAGAALAAVGWTTMIVASNWRNPASFVLFLAPATCVALMWWFSRRIPVEDLPEVAFALAYLNGLMLPLLMFGDYRNVGWWLALIACTGLVVQLVIIALRTRAARRLAAASKTSTLPESASPGS